MSDQADAGARPKLREILTPDELRGLAGSAGMSGEDIAKALAPLSGMPSEALQVAMTAGNALGRSMGMKASKSAEVTLAAPYPAVVRGLAFALSSQRYAVTTAFDTPGGAYLEAELPADLLAYGGTLQLDLTEEAPGRVRIAGASEIKGQMIDWGKGKRALNEVFAKTETFVRRLG